MYCIQFVYCKWESKIQESMQSSITPNVQVIKLQENTTHQKAKRSALSKQWPQSCKEQTRNHNKDKHET